MQNKKNEETNIYIKKKQKLYDQKGLSWFYYHLWLLLFSAGNFTLHLLCTE